MPPGPGPGVGVGVDVPPGPGVGVGVGVAVASGAPPLASPTFIFSQTELPSSEITSNPAVG